MSEEQQQNEPVGITINDLYSATQIIDAAVRRGAFGAEEAVGVGAVFQKLQGFLKETAPHLYEESTTEEVQNVE